MFIVTQSDILLILSKQPWTLKLSLLMYAQKTSNKCFHTWICSIGILIQVNEEKSRRWTAETRQDIELYRDNCEDLHFRGLSWSTLYKLNADSCICVALFVDSYWLTYT